MVDPNEKQTEQPEEDTEPEGENHDEEKPAEEGEEKPEGGEEVEAAGGEGEKDTAAAPEPEEKEKKVGGWQRRIAKLERQNEQLLAQLTAQLPAQRPTQPAAKPDAEKSPDEKAAEFVRALARQEREEFEQQRQEQAKVAEFHRRTAEVRAAHSDFDDVLLAADMPISPGLRQALLTSEYGPAIMYALAKNPGELSRLCDLPPLEAAREVGRLEARQTSSTASPKTTKPALRPPAPPTSVNGSASSTRSLDDLPLSEYKRAYRSGRR
jgi:hypothetical protein